MRSVRPLAVCLTWLALAASTPAATPDPLRLIPDQADLLLKIEQPRTLVENVLHHPLVKELERIDAVRKAYESTNVRQFTQLLAYVEKQLGVDRAELLDRLAGGGAALALHFGEGKQAPVLLVIQAREEPLLRRFFEVALQVVEQELTRQEVKARPEKSNYRGNDIVAIGGDFHTAVVGSALVVSNGREGIERAIDQHLDGGKKSLAQVGNVAEARRLAGPDPLLWLWINMESVRNTPGGKAFFADNNPVLKAAAGASLDIARRAPFVCGSVSAEKHGFAVHVRLPRGREGMPAALVSLLPPTGQPGSRPLLTPKGVLYSTSYYLNLAQMWENRAQLLDEQQLKKLEEFDKNSGKFLAGTPLSRLVTEAAPYQRIVVAHEDATGYQTRPGQYIPAFALVLELRAPESFSKRAETILRGAALLATTQVPLKLVEEQQGSHRIVGYRFAEDAKVKGDPIGLRFNFTPCFATVGNQFIISSRLQLCHELIELLEKEQAQPVAATPTPVTRTQLFASGGTALLEAFKDRLFTQTILDQALPPEQAKEQVQLFTDWLRRLGVLEIAADYTPQQFYYDIRLKLAD